MVPGKNQSRHPNASPPVSDTSLLVRKMHTDSMRSGEGRTSRGSTEHEYDVFLIFLFRDAEVLLDVVSRSKISIPIPSENCAASKWCLFRDASFLKGWESKEIANGHQGEFVRIVIETVLSELPVGIDEIIGLLDGTRTFGIYGMGGTGKNIFTCGELASRSFIPYIQEIMKHLLDDVDDKSGSMIIIVEGNGETRRKMIKKNEKGEKELLL